MTGFDTTFDHQAAAATKTSGLAVTSLIFSLILCCPLTTIIGPLLGLGALVQIGRNPALKGRGLAFAAIIMGIAFSVAQGFGGYSMYKNFIEPMYVGPRDALSSGFAGDIAGFKGHFYGSGATASDEQATAFIEQLRQRYGEFVSSELNPQTQPQGGPAMDFGYFLSFENTTVEAEAQIIYADETTGVWPKALGYIIVFDPDLGDLTYPLDRQTQFASALDAENWAAAIELYWDSAGELNQVAWKIVDDATVKNRDFDLAMKAAQRANELTEQKDAALLDTLARIYYETGDVKSALKWQRLAAQNLTGNEPFADDVRNALKKYEQADGDDGNGPDEADDADTDDQPDSDPDAGDGD